jgi:hypothetical protein
MRGRTKNEDLVSITLAAAELHRTYTATRDFALRGDLVLVWRGSTMFVTRGSLEALKASRARDRAPAIAGGR